MLKLRQHQKDAIEWLATRPKSMLALDAGLGKTCIAIKTFKPNENIIIISPATLKLNWVKEIKMWCNFKPEINLIEGRKGELRPGINIINYDIIGEKVGEKPEGKKKDNRKVVPSFNFKKFKADRVVLDESHFIKNSKAVRTKIGAKLVKLTPNALLLTGTPGERSIDLYVPLYSLGALSMNKHEFGIRFCDGKLFRIGRREVWDYRGNSNSDELKKLIAPKTLIMHKEDVIDLPEKIFKVVALDLPVSQQEKDYNLVDIIKDPRPLGFIGLPELLREQGILKLPLGLAHIKMRLETTKKVVVFCKHIDVLDELMKGLKAFNPVKLDGRMNAKKKDESVETFQNDKKCRVIVLQEQAGGVGITLTAASNVIFFETGWSWSWISQCSDRCNRIGATKTTYVELLTVHKSLDERVLYSTLEKKSFVEEVFYDRE